jgi:hypothetical protein
VHVVPKDAEAHNFTMECKEIRKQRREAGHRSGVRCPYCDTSTARGVVVI